MPKLSINFIEKLVIIWKAQLLRNSAPTLLLGHQENGSMPSDLSQPKRVLIIEDNELNLKLLNDILEYHGYTVFTSRLGEPALELAHLHRPDVILMDIQLPDISGMEATRRLKADEQTHTIPIIAVTAFAMSGDEAQILASGCDAYLAKPFSIVEFLNVVEHWTTNRA